jgi:alpha-mannosidase
MTPLESDPIPASFAPSSQSSASFLIVDNPNVVLSTWKRAEDGDGSIVRLTEIAGQQETVQLRTPHLRLQRVQQCSLLEDCTGDLPIRNDSVAVQLKPFEILTLKLQTLPESRP